MKEHIYTLNISDEHPNSITLPYVFLLHHLLHPYPSVYVTLQVKRWKFIIPLLAKLLSESILPKNFYCLNQLLFMHSHKTKQLFSDHWLAFLQLALMMILLPFRKSFNCSEWVINTTILITTVRIRLWGSTYTLGRRNDWRIFLSRETMDKEKSPLPNVIYDRLPNRQAENYKPIVRAKEN